MCVEGNSRGRTSRTRIQEPEMRPTIALAIGVLGFACPLAAQTALPTTTLKCASILLDGYFAYQARRLSSWSAWASRHVSPGRSWPSILSCKLTQARAAKSGNYPQSSPTATTPGRCGGLPVGTAASSPSLTNSGVARAPLLRRSRSHFRIRVRNGLVSRPARGRQSHGFARDPGTGWVSRDRRGRGSKLRRGPEGRRLPILRNPRDLPHLHGRTV
jgi:hypothetical protein